MASGGDGRGRRWLGLLVLPLGLTAAGCTVLVDKSTTQCDTTSDCAFLPGTSCVENVCVAGAAECSVNSDCIAKAGQYHICRKSDHSCQPLQSPLCTTIEGDWANDNAVILGSVGPTTGGDALTGKTIENSIKLAIGDFTTAANGLPGVPPSTARRPLVLVGCDDASDTDTAVEAATHLAGTVGVPALIGAAYSGITIGMATDVTIPAGVLTISPSATSAAITDLADNDLVWRTSPSDVLQAAAVQGYVPLLETQVRTTLALQPTDKVKLFVLNKGDAYGTGLAEALEPALVLNGASALDPSNQGFYTRFDYGNPDDPQSNPTKYAEAVLAVLANEPHIVLVFGTTEGVTDVFTPVETQWLDLQPPPAYAPLWLFSDGGLVPDLWGAVGTDVALRRRVTGTVPGTTDPLFLAYRQKYSLRFPSDGTSPDVFGGAGAYDATYLLAYAAVSLGATPVTGATLAAALRAGRLGSTTTTADPLSVGQTGINAAYQKLVAGQSIDFAGASGPLDFDLATGEARSDIQIWCMPQDAGGNAQGGIGSGIYYSAASSSLVGTTYGAQCEF
ncbi:MAG: ABC transporter substrate-binding protein [Polyangiaceae bacterium]|nr:ABC transporter substrate-binding protein [Polyangiaceae bacterium]